MSYEGLVEDLIASQAELLGDQAVEIAAGVRGLHVNPDGSVDEITSDGKTVVDDLVSAYTDRLGPAAEAAMRSTAAAHESDVDLPRSLE